MGEALCTVVNDIINNKRTKNKTREVEVAIAYSFPFFTYSSFFITHLKTLNSLTY